MHSSWWLRLSASSAADPPTVEPIFTEIRQGISRTFSMNCRVLRAHPHKVLKYEWRLGNRVLSTGLVDTRDETEYNVRSLNREGYGEYTCDISNEAGGGRCSFLVTGKSRSRTSVQPQTAAATQQILCSLESLIIQEIWHLNCHVILLSVHHKLYTYVLVVVRLGRWNADVLGQARARQKK